MLHTALFICAASQRAWALIYHQHKRVLMKTWYILWKLSLGNMSLIDLAVWHGVMTLPRLWQAVRCMISYTWGWNIIRKQLYLHYLHHFIFAINVVCLFFVLFLDVGHWVIYVRERIQKVQISLGESILFYKI